jgi:hypothetical protein
VESVTSFSSKMHGYKFVNSFKIELKYNLPLIGEVDLGDFIVGLCGGMCFSALDNYHAGIPISSRKTVPQTGSAMRNLLIKKQLQSLIPPDGIIKVLAWTVRDDKYVWRRTAGSELRKLRTRLDKGQPAVLALIRADREGDPTKNHQVIAQAYSYDEHSGDLLVKIYDPNHPLKTPTLTMNFNSPNTGIHAIQSTGEPLRGFFVIDYEPPS